MIHFKPVLRYLLDLRVKNYQTLVYYLVEKNVNCYFFDISIFLINPSPICILDEVDAPLDDINVEKFCKILAELKNNTKNKFLIITHHKITMSSIDRVYGVTMAQKGISDIVSVDFDKDNLKEAV